MIRKLKYFWEFIKWYVSGKDGKAAMPLWEQPELMEDIILKRKNSPLH